MKLFLIVTITFLLPLGLMLPVKADVSQDDPSSQSTTVQITPEPVQQNDSQPEDSSRFESIANQINQQVSGDSNQTNRPSSGNLIRDLFNLPEGMVVRGSRGGVAVGTEL